MTGTSGDDEFTFEDLFGPRRNTELPARDGHTGELPVVYDETQIPYPDLDPDTLEQVWEASHGADGHVDGTGTPANLPVLPADRLPYAWHPQAWAQRRVDHAHRAEAVAAYLAECVTAGLTPEEAQRRARLFMDHGAEAVAWDVWKRTPEGIAESLRRPMLPPVSPADVGSIYAAMAGGKVPVLEPTAVLTPGEAQAMAAGVTDMRPPSRHAKPAAPKPKAPAPPGVRRTRPSRARKAAINRDTP
jgi:hypothetical protein